MDAARPLSFQPSAPPHWHCVWFRGAGVASVFLCLCRGGRFHRFCCGVFADNFVLLGEPAELVVMWAELSEKIQLQKIRWKPTSICVLGPEGETLKSPAVGSQGAVSVVCSALLPFLGRTLVYEDGLGVAVERAFESGNAAWHANRKQLYARKFCLRLRLQLFTQTAKAVLLMHLCEFPWTLATAPRARRWGS